MLKSTLPNAPMLPLCNPSPQVFSAPCYPQFGESFANLGAVAVLGPPAFDSPRFVQYEAAPRPQVSDIEQGAGRRDMLGRLVLGPSLPGCYHASTSIAVRSIP